MNEQYQQWEYLDICPTYTPGFSLNDLGKQGWELVAVWNGRFFFKRKTG